MTTTEFVSYLGSLGVTLSAEGDQLRITAPKGTLTPALRRELSQRKAEILILLNGDAHPTRFNSTPIQPISRERNVPLSFAQQRLWFLNQLEPGSSLYNMPVLTFRLKGPLNLQALQRSLNEIMRQHEGLRTTFECRDGQPVQIIAPSLDLPVSMVDLQDLSETTRETEALRLAEQEVRRPFDITRGPLIRAALLRLSEENHILLLPMHHIVSDGWSLGIILRELSVLYGAFLAGRPSPLTELPIQYADFAHWQRQWLQGEVLENQLSYWKEQIGKNPPALALPTDRPRPPVQTYNGARQSVAISKALTKGLKELSRRERVTLFVTLLAAFKTLLYRYTGQDDIIVGSPIANRNLAGTEGIVGFFVNTLALRTNLFSKPTFQQLMLRVRETVLGAFSHQDLPFEKLVEALQLERDLSRNPLFQVMFVLQNAKMSPLELAGLSVNRMEIESGISRFDLTLSLIETASSLVGFVEYNTNLFEAATITRMLGHFQTLLKGIVANPDQPISDLPLLLEPERHQLLVEWNDTQVDHPQDKCLHQLFEAQVEQTPDAVALLFEDEQLTYGELNCRANQVAHHLRALGVGPEVLVGICMERSPEMVVGLLGILKAGGAYVPLDPDYPKDRLDFMLEDSGAPVLLTQRKLVDSLISELKSHTSDGHVVLLDDFLAHSKVLQSAIHNPHSGVSPDNLAYVIYTSGSTGKPKGVQIPHRAVANFLNSMRQQPGLTNQDTLLAVTTLSFDIAALEIFLPMTSGARLELISREVAADGTLLLHRLASSGATIMQATPATWRLLLEAGWQGSNHLKILCGGEALPRELAAELLTRGSSLWNLYGPTETTIWSAVYPVDLSDRPIPIGHPIANTQIHILDSHLQPVPVGVPGELHIGGAGLARGYMNRPELTAEKFILNPFSDDPGARLYKTGDLARYLPDGNIEFLGRIDHQVKVRGFRIELGEIEAVLGQHPEIREAVVMAREDTPESKRLVAYVVPKQEQAPTINELRSFLKQKLPDYMVPSVFVPLEVLPLTTNGKVNRRALPPPDQTRPELEKTFVAPRTPVEEALAGIWSEVLKIEQVGIHDNFFDLGGHSLLATQVMSRVRETFQVELPLRSFFEAPTVAELAAIMLQDSDKRAKVERKAQLLLAVNQLSDDQVKRMLHEKRVSSIEGNRT